MQVPFSNLPAQHEKLHTEILEQWRNILKTGNFIGGKYVEIFERNFADACETKYCVSVGSGTDALRFIFLALDLQPGDEVIVPVNTFIASSEAITQAGATPRFIDIDPNTYNIDTTRLPKAINSKTKGILAVHLYGQPADMEAINSIASQHSLWVVEDACQAHLAEFQNKKAGSLSVAAAFSFYPGKNLGACGEAGAVTTSDPELAATIQKLRNHGQSRKYIHDIEGYNGRCDALQAAALTIKLKHLAEWTETRRKIAEQYRKELEQSNAILPLILRDTYSVYHLFVILVQNREKVIAYLEEQGISTGLHYPIPLHLQEAYSHLPYVPGDFPVAERCAEMLLSLPMFPELTGEQVSYVSTKVIEALKIYA